MPKLLQINVCSAVLSTGKIAEDIANKARESRWETYMAWGRFSKPSPSIQIRVGSKVDTYIHFAEHKLFDREGLASKKATRKLIKQIEKISPDIIHLHNIHDHYLNYPLLFGYLAKADIPVVWTLHDCWAFTGGCMYYDLQNCDRWKTGCMNCPEHRALFCDTTKKQYALKRELLERINNLTYVPVSNWLEHAVLESHQKHRPVVTIHNGIDINLFKPQKQLRDNKRFRIIGVAAVWDKRKGLEDFIKLHSSLPEKEFDITLVGLTKKQIRSLPNGINGITRTTNIQELVQLYSDADVFINTTYSDNFPTVNLEALACGTPVITYRTGGSPEAVDEKTGIVVEQGDLNGIVSAIERLRESPLSSEACRKRAEEHFDKDKCFMKYIKLYESLL